MNAVVVGVGTNLGAREAAIRAAAELLAARPGIELVGTSPLYETAPLGPPQDRYLNAAYRLKTSLSPPALLRVLLRTERRLGRVRHADQRWGPRSVDLDVLWDFRGPFTGPALVVPHRELENRDFALAPLLDVAPELQHALGRVLEDVGGRPPVWNREALIDRRVVDGIVQVEVESDSPADACALAIHAARFEVRPWSTRHVVVEPSPEGFAAALQGLVRTGFRARAATVSHCSQSQWNVEFHGASQGARSEADVRLWTTSGARRAGRVSLRIAL